MPPIRNILALLASALLAAGCASRKQEKNIMPPAEAPPPLRGVQQIESGPGVAAATLPTDSGRMLAGK